MRKKRYLRHTPRSVLALRALQSLFGIGAVAVGAHRTATGLLKGEVQAPLRGADIVVTTASPDWFVIVLLIWVLLTALMGFVAFVFIRQFIEALRH
jgi:hypothetical protein